MNETQFTWICGVQYEIISKELIVSYTLKGKRFEYTSVMVRAV